MIKPFNIEETSLASIFSSAAKDPQLSEDSFKSIMSMTQQMEAQDAFEVLKNCAGNSALSSKNQMAGILVTTGKCLGVNDGWHTPKRNYIYQTLLERDNLSLEDIDAIAHAALGRPTITISEARTACAVLERPQIAKATAEYINGYIDRLPNDNSNKGALIAHLMGHCDRGLYEQLEKKADELAGDAKRSYNIERNSMRNSGQSNNSQRTDDLRRKMQSKTYI